MQEQSFENQVLLGDALDVLRTLPDEHVQMCVTSPPYWGLRDYGVEGQIGLERTPEEYISRLVGIFSEVRRVLKKDGTLWLNLGDCYATGAGKVGECPGGGEQGARWKGHRGSRSGSQKQANGAMGPTIQPNRMPIQGMKPKDLVGVPWSVAFALRADGWYLRRDIIWSKPNPMPESVLDRPTTAHEYVFLLSKSERYFYNSDAIKEPAAYLQPNSPESIKSPYGQGFTRRAKGNAKTFRGGCAYTQVRSFDNSADVEHESHGNVPNESGLRNKRSVWTVATQPFPEAHFATFPPALIQPCILAGSRIGDVVIDPFMGAGTMGVVAGKLGRKWVGIELNPKYKAMAELRIKRECAQLNMFHKDVV